jgi:hypothetical protein
MKGAIFLKMTLSLRGLGCSHSRTLIAPQTADELGKKSPSNRTRKQTNSPGFSPGSSPRLEQLSRTSTAVLLSRADSLVYRLPESSVKVVAIAIGTPSQQGESVGTPSSIKELTARACLPAPVQPCCDQVFLDLSRAILKPPQPAMTNAGQRRKIDRHSPRFGGTSVSSISPDGLG